MISWRVAKIAFWRHVMPLLEARAGFEIENIVTIADKLFWHLRAEGTADLATREALRYRHALLGGCSAESIMVVADRVHAGEVVAKRG